MAADDTLSWSTSWGCGGSFLTQEEAFSSLELTQKPPLSPSSSPTSSPSAAQGITSTVSSISVVFAIPTNNDLPA